MGPEYPGEGAINSNIAGPKEDKTYLELISWQIESVSLSTRKKAEKFQKMSKKK